MAVGIPASLGGGTGGIPASPGGGTGEVPAPPGSAEQNKGVRPKSSAGQGEGEWTTSEENQTHRFYLG